MFHVREIKGIVVMSPHNAVILECYKVLSLNEHVSILRFEITRYSISSSPQSIFQANRDAGIREAECEKAAMDVKYNTDTKIEDNSRAFKLQKANFDKEVNTAVS